MAHTALLTDMYELTMLRSAVGDGTADSAAAFEVHSRRLPSGRRFGVLAGLGRLLDALETFSFAPGDAALGWLRARDVIDEATQRWLDGWSFTGRITAYAEGELYFPGSPVLRVEGRLGEALLLETIVLSMLNHDAAVATAAARMRLAAGTRTLIEMGSRRTHERAAVSAARAAVLAGFDATSNLAAGRSYGLRVVGTAAHAWVQAHLDEAAAFDAQIAALGVDTTLLVDTYDIAEGVQQAVAAARRVGAAGPGGVRIDSGDLALESKRVRQLLDDLGAADTRIVVSGDLDEHRIEELAEAPVDGFGVGTRVVSGLPSPGFVYKLVAIGEAGTPPEELRPVHKRSEGKHTVGGCKQAWRELDAAGLAVAERIRPLGEDVPAAEPGHTLRPLQTVVWDGTRTHRGSFHDAQEHHRASMAELGEDARDLRPGDPVVPTDLHTPR